MTNMVILSHPPINFGLRPSARVGGHEIAGLLGCALRTPEERPWGWWWWWYSGAAVSGGDGGNCSGGGDEDVMLCCAPGTPEEWLWEWSLMVSARIVMVVTNMHVMQICAWHLIEENIVPSSVGSAHLVHRQEKYFVSAGKKPLWAFFLNSKMTTFCSQNQSRILRSLKRSLFISTAILNLTKMNLTVAGSPHGVGVVDTDVLPLLDVHCCPDHHSAQQNCHRHCGEINLAKIRALHLCIFFRFPLGSSIPFVFKAFY